MVQSIFESRDGTIWFGTWDGLVRLRDGQLSTYIVPDPFLTEIRSIGEDREGTLWLGTSRGLARLVGETIEPFRPKSPWSASSVEAVHQDPEGVMWFGTDGAGLLRLEGETLTTMRSQDGLFDDTVFHILEDDSGYLWLCGSPRRVPGGPRFPPRVRGGARAQVKGTLYGVAHGMKSSECTGGGAQPGAFRDPKGRLWFPTNQGVVMIDPERQRARGRPRGAPRGRAAGPHFLSPLRGTSSPDLAAATSRSATRP